MDDSRTVDYFDRHVVEFHEARLDRVVAALRDLGGPESRLVDVGCGVGNILERIARDTPVRRLCGVDPSANCLERTRERLASTGVRCELEQGSILDDGFVARLEGRFDFALLSAVLHHLIGPTRWASRALAGRAVQNALRLLAPSGRLLIAEPVFAPRLPMDALFWLKTLVTRFTGSRVGLFGYANNIGAPVVSYYGAADVRQMVLAAGSVETAWLDETWISGLYRLAGIRSRHDLTLVARRTV